MLESQLAALEYLSVEYNHIFGNEFVRFLYSSLDGACVTAQPIGNGKLDDE